MSSAPKDTQHLISRLSKNLLGSGIMSAPLFIVIFLCEVVFRSHYNAVKMPLSLLALGSNGWIHIANFASTGLLALFGAIGLTLLGYRSANRTAWGPRLFAMYGIALIAAAAFQTDASNGFPVGTPEGPPVSFTVHGIIHWAAFFVIMLSLTGSAFVWSRWFYRQKHSAMGLYSLIVGILVPALIVFTFATGAILGITAATFIGYSFVSVVCLQLRKQVGQMTTDVRP